MLPTVDLRDAGASRELAAGFAALGFVQVTGHGIDQQGIADLRSACDHFFDLPAATKAQFIDPVPEHNRGWRGRGSEALSYSLGQPSAPDLFESFNCAADDRSAPHPLLAPTPWPDLVAPSLRSAATAFLAEMEVVARRLDGLIDAALGSRFVELSDSGPDTMACIDYRPSPDGSEPVVDGQQRMGAHSDYTTFTVLLADPVPGLQIISDGEWVDVAPEPGALLVNVGDLLAIATNDAWPSTLHRVVPMDAGCEPRRRSVAYFHYPNLDVEVAPLPKFSPQSGGYSPVRVDRHLESKLGAPKRHEPSTGVTTTSGRLD